MPHTPPPYRRLTLLDLVFLTAALALGWGAWLLDVRASAFIYKTSKNPTPKDWEAWFHFGAIQLLILAALVAVRSIRWPRAEQVQPGIVGCWGAVIAALVLVVQDSTESYLYLRGFGVTLPAWEAVASHWVGLLHAPGPIAAGVLIGWLTIAHAGLWHRASGTIELFGRVVSLSLLLGFLGGAVARFVRAYQIFH